MSCLQTGSFRRRKRKCLKSTLFARAVIQVTDISAYKTFLPVKEATAVDSCHVDVAFIDGRSARVDFSDIIGDGPWAPLADPNFFKLAHAEYDTVIWTEDIDVSPEYVWDLAKDQLEQATS